MSAPCARCGLVAPAGVGLCPRCLLTSDEEDDTELAPEAENAQLLALPGLELGSLVGRGGMGHVWRARHVRLGRDVAVKVIAPELSRDPAFVARFEREARALARLNHPHVISIYDFGVNGQGLLFLVMEFAPGGTLAARLPLSPEAARAVALALADALAAAHEAGLVHRDIKPLNVLFDARDQPKLADFGLARLLAPEAADGLTHPAFVAGTPQYMAPEARAGAPPHPSADLYALGVLLREMLTGSALPSASVPLANFSALIARATAELPEQRFADAHSFAAALRAIRVPAAHLPANAPQALPPEERSWLQAVSLCFAAANAVALYAFVSSFTPRIMHSDEALPMIVFGTRTLPDGRVFTQARFETWPTLAAGAAFAIALASYGLLRRHWRHAGLEGANEQPIESANQVLKLGAALAVLHAIHLALEHTWFANIGPYMPVFGGTLEFVLLYLVWLSLLEAVRRHRTLLGERRLWLGLGLGLIPPTLAFLRMLRVGR